MNASRRILLGAVAAGAALPAVAGPIDALGWLAGCWAAEQGARRVEEQWMDPRGGAMLGMARTVVEGRTVEWEHLRVHEDGAALVYTARPSGQPEAAFRAAAAGRSEAVFENPGHDFPQRIRYRLEADGSLLARIEGERGGQPHHAEFAMRRVACPG